ncbi:MAG: AAA family ATPase [Acholeplasmatales bacterium]|nr:AAA family ATPase [Acholeplasmatales bacterium]
MIRTVEFNNFRNLNRVYRIDNKLNVIFGKNNSGKTNLLDGIRIAFSAITNDYCKIKKSDFAESDDSKKIVIKVKMDPDDIPSLNYVNGHTIECGFIVEITKTQKGRYTKKVFLYDGNTVDYEILREDEHLPNIYVIPLIRVDEIYTDWLSTGISAFIESEEKYKDIKAESKKNIKTAMSNKIDIFKNFCSKFNENFDIELTEPKITDEKVFIVDGDNEYNYNIGSGYKSIANIILNSMDNSFSIILIDEIENHLHPSLIRTLIREIKSLNENAQIISTTHSPVIINEVRADELIDISGNKISDIDEENVKKLEKFLHTGRSEIVFGDNIILVEGYTEELLIKNYLYTNNYNWTVVNVGGIMFEPYIELATILKKKIIVVSDDDVVLSSDKKTPSSRYIKLQNYCNKKGVTIVNTYNTLESDLYKNGIISGKNLIKKEDCDIYVAKQGLKTLIMQELILDDDFDTKIDSWHIVKEIKNEFGNN